MALCLGLSAVLFGLALSMAIPPVPSKAGHVYHLLPVAAIGGSALLASLFLAVHRGGENWLPAFLRLVFYLAFLYALQMRMNIR